MRKAYGAGYYVMCGKGYEPDVLVAWPFADDLGDGARRRGQHHLQQADRSVVRSRGDARAG